MVGRAGTVEVPGLKSETWGTRMCGWDGEGKRNGGRGRCESHPCRKVRVKSGAPEFVVDWRGQKRGGTQLLELRLNSMGRAFVCRWREWLTVSIGGQGFSGIGHIWRGGLLDEGSLSVHFMRLNETWADGRVVLELR